MNFSVMKTGKLLGNLKLKHLKMFRLMNSFPLEAKPIFFRSGKENIKKLKVSSKSQSKNNKFEKNQNVHLGVII